MLENFGVAFALFMFMAAFIGLNLVAARLLSPKNPSAAKSVPYDCGEPPVGNGYRQFNLRFYLVALVFVIFDVEIAFMYPVSAVFRELTLDGWGVMAFEEISIFVLILTVGFVYAWSEGGLDWVREQITSPTEGK